jgi:lysozyme
MKITDVSPEGLTLLKQFEGLRLSAYLDSAGIPTIGYGTIRYPNGEKVKMGDLCTPDQADMYFAHDLQRFERAVDALSVDTLSQRQFDALTSFTYNTGENAYRTSTLRKVVNVNPNDPGIRRQFQKWHFAGGRPIKGLWKRRHREADFYFGVKTPLPAWPH